MMIYKAEHQWVTIEAQLMFSYLPIGYCSYNIKSPGFQQTKQHKKNDFGVMKKVVVDPKKRKKKKAYETGLCILLFNGDRQVSSVNCPSALWYLLPIFAGFRISLKSIWALQKRGTSSFCHYDRRASITRGSLSIWRSKKLSQWPTSVWDHTSETHKKVTFSLILHCSDQLDSYKYVYVCDLFSVFMLQL